MDSVYLSVHRSRLFVFMFVFVYGLPGIALFGFALVSIGNRCMLIVDGAVVTILKRIQISNVAASAASIEGTGT